ncbi:uncharacterized protein LOC111918539 [Lactuca sativa]|uniref:Vacuolar protein sorting-associated protein Ist1 n=1 Tax=Lactuca sativa TaxID=4236 RepID=A0A9R1X0K1_LACSA|nr:uncharacterized protein LOC111918539 [Lactuca sativa]KAJ0191942.1 hypothetical protein LSAT_V11C800426690 [Lactuca sativa]
MLDGLLGRSGFSSKCKSLIKPTRTRIEALRRRAEAKQRFLKEDLAKLLANGLDVNAYGRTEDFIAGLNLLSCYNFIDQSCEYILKQLSVMQKLGQCPEECRETVASLMFAAARFSDLPELRDLRDVFQERYGNGLECYVNQMFVEKLASKPPVVEKRIKLLQDIAAEFSIQWDSKGFKQRMDSPSTLAQDQVRKSVASITTDENNDFRKNDHRSKERIEQIPHNDGSVNVRRKEVFVRTEEKHAQDQAMKFRASNVTDDKYKVPNGNVKTDERSKERIEHSYVGPTLGRQEKLHNLNLNLKHQVYLSKPRPESDSGNNGIGNNHISATSYLDKRPERHTRMPQVNREEQEEEYVEKSTTRKVQEKEEEPVRLLKPCYNNTPPLPPPYIIKSNIPPPYTKPNHHQQPPSDLLPPPISERRNKEQNQNDMPLPKPRSVRRKHSKSSSSHDDVGSSEDSRIVKRVSSSRRKERKGLQILFDDEHYHHKAKAKDEEEKMMDKLLLHYSKKPSAYDHGKVRRKKSTKSPPVNDNDNDNDDEVEVETNVSVPPMRSISLPHESDANNNKKKKVYARANSFQPDNQAPHVHPKLPDYDDLAARFAALRGR